MSLTRQQYKTIFFLNDQPIGFCYVTKFFRADTWVLPRSYALLCPTCGDIWARWEVLAPGTNHSSLAVHCESHDTGSFFQPAVISRAWYYDDALPIEVLQRDYEYLCQFGKSG